MGMKNALIVALMLSVFLAYPVYGLGEVAEITVTDPVTGLAVTQDSPLLTCPEPVTALDIAIGITNLGQETRIFDLSLNLPEGWEGEIQDDITLSSGEKDSIDLFLLNMPSATAPGVYPVTLSATSWGETVSYTIYIETLSCHRVELKAQEPVKEACIETESQAGFSLELSNLGKQAETFQLTALYQGLPASFVNLTPEVEVQGDSKKVVPLLVDTEGFSGQELDIVVEAKSRNSYARDTETLRLKVRDCFEFTLDLQPGEKEACLGKETKYMLTVNNLGETDTYRIITPDWVQPGSDYISVGKRDSATLEVAAVARDSTGPLKFDLMVESGRAPGFSKKVTGTLNSKECREVAVLVSPTEDTVCQGRTASFKVSVKNLGTLEDTFDVTSSLGSLEKSKVFLKPGQIEELELNVDTKNLEGTREIKVFAGSEGISDETLVSLVIENCYKAGVEVFPPEVSACPCSSVPYTVTVQNMGEFPDEYTLVFGDETEQVSLEPGKTASFIYAVSVSCDSEGLYEVVAAVSSQHTEASGGSVLEVLTEEECWAVKLMDRKIITARVEAQKALAVPLQIKNAGTEAGTFGLKILDGPEWSEVSPASLELESGEEGEVYLYLSPPFGSEGNYSVLVGAESPKTEAGTLVTVLVGPLDGQEPITIEEIPQEPEGTDGITGHMISAVPAWKAIAVGIITLVIVIILIVRFAFLVKA